MGRIGMIKFRSFLHYDFLQYLLVLALATMNLTNPIAPTSSVAG